MQRSLQSWVRGASLGLWVLSLAGCGEPTPTQVAPPSAVHNSPPPIVAQPPKPAIKVDNVIELKPSDGEPIKIVGCTATLTALGTGRPVVFQATTDWSFERPASFPSVLFWAQTDVDMAPALANRTLKGRLFIRLEQNGPIWQTPDGIAAELTIQAIDMGGFRAALAPCQLFSTETGRERTWSGTLSGIVKFTPGP